MRVLVTGAAGRLGRSVVAVLAQAGHTVAAADVVDGGCPDPAQSIVADLRDPDALTDVLAEVAPEAVVHLAGIAVPFARPEPETLAVNAELAWGVLDASARRGVRTVIAASSPTVIGYGDPAGWTPAYLPLDEDHPVQPWNGYAQSKLVIEQVSRTMAGRHRDTRFSTVRPCYVIAPEEWAGAPTQQGHTVRERLARPELAAPSLFNYVDARDVGELVDALLGEHDLASGDILFAGAADALAERPLAELLPEYVPSTALAAAALQGTRPAFGTDRARKLVGWVPRRSWRTELR